MVMLCFSLGAYKIHIGMFGLPEVFYGVNGSSINCNNL
jgi:hypothetical protein